MKQKLVAFSALPANLRIIQAEIRNAKKVHPAVWVECTFKTDYFKN